MKRPLALFAALWLVLACVGCSPTLLTLPLKAHGEDNGPQI